MTDEFEQVDPETLREWKEERLNEFKREMRSYLQGFPDATPEEKRDLHRWVNSGHSPYENGDYVVSDSGEPMDYIHAGRFLEEVYRNGLSHSDSNHETQDSKAEVSPVIDPETGGELPF